MQGIANDLEVGIRPWADGDLAVLRACNTPEMTSMLGGPETDDKLAERHERYLRLTEPGAGRMYVIVLGPELEPVGNVGFWEKEWRGEQLYETGWHVLSTHQGRGIASAAVRLVLREAAAAGRHRWMHAFPSVDNGPSNAVCRKVGFELAGQYDFEYPPGHALLTNDWRLDLHRVEPDA